MGEAPFEVGSRSRAAPLHQRPALPFAIHMQHVGVAMWQHLLGHTVSRWTLSTFVLLLVVWTTELSTMTLVDTSDNKRGGFQEAALGWISALGALVHEHAETLAARNLFSDTTGSDLSL
jgi:hypothetical protein